MIYRVIMFPPFCPRSLRSISHQRHGATLQPTGRRDLGSLAPSVSRYFQNGLAPQPRSHMQRHSNVFTTSAPCFMSPHPFPVTEHLLCCFAAYLADQGLAPQTGISYLAAVHNMQTSLGLPDPILKRVQAGTKRARLQRNIPPRIRLPITAKVLEQIRITLDRSSNPQKVLLWAEACTAFFGFFRLRKLLQARQ